MLVWGHWGLVWGEDWVSCDRVGCVNVVYFSRILTFLEQWGRSCKAPLSHTLGWECGPICASQGAGKSSGWELSVLFGKFTEEAFLSVNYAACITWRDLFPSRWWQCDIHLINILHLASCKWTTCLSGSHLLWSSKIFYILGQSSELMDMWWRQ